MCLLENILLFVQKRPIFAPFLDKKCNIFQHTRRRYPSILQNVHIYVTNHLQKKLTKINHTEKSSSTWNFRLPYVLFWVTGPSEIPIFCPGIPNHHRNLWKPFRCANHNPAQCHERLKKRSKSAPLPP